MQKLIVILMQLQIFIVMLSNVRKHKSIDDVFIELSIHVIHKRLVKN